MSWVCENCGSSIKKLDIENGLYICAFCGTEVVTPESEQQQMYYAQTVKLANDNLKVGNWDAAKKLVYRLIGDYPGNASLYLIALAAVTKNYSDLLVGCSSAQRNEAAWLWDKLDALGRVSGSMISYLRSKMKLLTVYAVIVLSQRKCFLSS